MTGAVEKSDIIPKTTAPDALRMFFFISSSPTTFDRTFSFLHPLEHASAPPEWLL
jgi:hypothetical protein